MPTPEISGDQQAVAAKSRLAPSPVRSAPRLSRPHKAGEAAQVDAGEWVRYGTPYEGGAEYVSVCLPAFSPGAAHRDPS